jgi:hypothetical protein
MNADRVSRDAQRLIDPGHRSAGNGKMLVRHRTDYRDHCLFISS